MIASGVENAEHNDLVALQPVEELIRKAPRQNPAKPAIIIWRPLRISRQTFDRVSNVG